MNGLNYELLTNNPNASNPERLQRAEALTCVQDHGYTAEQKAFHGGLMDKFVEYTNQDQCSPPDVSKPGLVMDYYDGNTVTALWSYAQNFAMSDNSFGTTFGPSTPGALHLISGQTHGATPSDLPNEIANGTIIGDPDPTFDDCSDSDSLTAALSGTNIGNLLNQAGVTWGWFEGGFKPTSHTDNSKAVCGQTTKNISGVDVTAYSPHHESFQYYQSTSNPHHLPPGSVKAIGHSDQANHQYDLSDFWNAAYAGNLPAASFLKASKAEDGHAGYSDPLDEQRFVVNTLNRLQMLNPRQWRHTVVIIAYDDSDAWYDHVMGPIVNQSNDSANDALNDGSCGEDTDGGYMDRCGYGPRLPLLVISHWARPSFIDHSVTDQTSILRFIEDNWHLPRIGNQSFDAKAGSLMNLFDFSRGRQKKHARRLFLNPETGLPFGGYNPERKAREYMNKVKR